VDLIQDRYRLKWIALFGVSLLAFTAFLDATIVNTALPFIQKALGANILQLQWIANIFTIILSMTMIAVGKLADHCGRKKIFYWGVILFAIAALGAGFSTAVAPLVFFRGLQALGASTIFITSAALLSDVFPEKERVRAISIYGGITGFGLMIGPFLGGILIGLFDWRWVFWINLPLIAIGLGLCSFSVK
jgi:MFS family permease